MKSRRREDYMMAQSPSPKVRNQHRFEMNRDSYAMLRRDNEDRAPRIERRSLSPRTKIEGSRRMVLPGERRGHSIERREYSWHLGAGRTENIISRSPQYTQEHKRNHFDEGSMHRKYDYDEDIDYNDGKSNRMKQVYGYDHHGTSSRMSKEKDIYRNSFADIDGIGMKGQKSVRTEDRMIRGSYRVPQDLVPTSSYGESRETSELPVTSWSMDIGQFEHEKIQYLESIPSDNITKELYKKGEKPMYHPRDAPYIMASTSHSKDFGSSSQFKDYAGASSRVSRSEFPSSYRERVPFPASDEYRRSSVKLIDTMDFDTYSQRSIGRDNEATKRIIKSYPKGDYSPERSDYDDYLYPKSQAIVNDDYIYPSNDSHRMTSTRSRLDYEYAQTDYGHRESSRSNLMHPVVEKIHHAEDSYGNMRKSTVWDHPTIQKQVATENLDTSILYRSKNSGEYVDGRCTRVEFGPRDARDNMKSHSGVTQDHQISCLRSDYGFGRDAGPQFVQEVLQDPPTPIYDLEVQKLDAKRPRMKEELAPYERSEKVLRRKYIMEDINRPGTGTNVSSKWVAPNEFEDLYDSGEEWIDEGTGASHVSRTRRLDHNSHRKAKRAYDGRDYPEDFASEDWVTSQDSRAHARKHSARYYKPESKYVKGHPKSGSLSWYASHQSDRRSAVHRQHKTWKRIGGYGEDTNVNDDEASEEWVNTGVSEPSEDSEEFKQLVDEAFLTYSKKLNLSTALRRRYMEQGKAGSLFCIVCGRSSSKDFMDTQRLVTHAFMSHKVGLRANHMGLHKAICVLMGWNTFVPGDAITWVPEALPDAEALALKEDLILWPPLVVIHNISMSNNNPEHQKVVPIEGVEAFLRGKGFVGGKIKVCLGKPADQSVMLVKFLGTFTGIGNAERLHKYFVENKHGREEFEQKISNNGKSSNCRELGMQRELEENLLYGYLGIAADLDRLDYNTKKWIIIKSKKEIQDLANAPVKADDR